MKQVYLDHAALTPIAPEVMKKMTRVQESHYANPASLHAPGQAARKELDHARSAVAAVLHCKPNEIIFTSGGTESVNLAILGMVRSQSHGHVITTAIEHLAVLNSVRALEHEGYSTTIVSSSSVAGSVGIVSVTDVISQITPGTVLVSMMYANNEIGTIQPIAELAKELKKINRDREARSLPRIYLHADACQAPGYLDIDTQKLGIDLLSLNGEKIYGPRGFGLLYVRAGTPIQPIVFGGGQQHGLRSGTEDVADACGFALALEIADAKKGKESKRLSGLRDYFFAELRKLFPDAIVNGEVGDLRLPNNVNISLPGTDGESMVIYLSAMGVYCSTGSACSSATSEPSHVLRAIAPHEPDRALSSLRFTLGRDTTKGDISYALKSLKAAYANIRS